MRPLHALKFKPKMLTYDDYHPKENGRIAVLRSRSNLV